MLDDALLAMLLEEWEKGEEEFASGSNPGSWDVQTLPLVRELGNCLQLIPEWALQDCSPLNRLKAADSEFLANKGEWMLSYYFARSRRFLQESLAVHSVRRRANMVVKGRLPVELVEEVVRIVSREEDVPIERLRTRVENRTMFKDPNRRRWCHSIHEVFPK